MASPDFSRRRRRILTALVLLASILLVPLTAHSLTIAYWRFEEGAAGQPAGTILDSSGNELSGAAVNGPIYSTQVPTSTVPQTGRSDRYSLLFNGTTQRVSFPDYPQLALTKSFTIEAYVKVFGQLGAADDIVFRGDDRTALDPYVLNVKNGTLGLAIEDAAGDSQAVSTPIPFNTWLHVAGELNDSTGRLSLYVNGTLASFLSTSIRPFASLDPSFSPASGSATSSRPITTSILTDSLTKCAISNQALAPDQFLDQVPEPSSHGLLHLRPA